MVGIINYQSIQHENFPKSISGGLIISKFVEVLESLIEYLCLKYLVHTSKGRVEIVVLFPSLINFGIVHIWPIYQSLNNRICFTILSFFHPKESCVHPPLYVTFSVRPFVADHISGTIHHLIIIFGTHV